MILRNLSKEYKWIARDRDNGIMVYKTKPKKLDNCWSRKMISEFEIFYMYDNLFQSIKWKDKEPCEFRKYI